MPNDAQVNAGLYQGDGVRGCSQREIARDLHISRSTVAKYLSEDLSPRPHAVAGRTSPTMAPFAEEVVSWLGADRLAPKKQRRTAKRVYDRLVSGYGFPGSRSIVERFVRNWRDSRPPAPAAGFLELGWPSRAARGDYGNAVTGPGSPVGEEGMAAADADGLLAHLGSRHPPDAGVFALGNVPAGLSEDDADLAPGILARIPEHDDSPGGYAREDAAAAPIGDSGMASEGASSERAEDRTSVLGKPSRIGLGDRTGGSGGRPMVGGLGRRPLRMPAQAALARGRLEPGLQLDWHSGQRSLRIGHATLCLQPITLGPAGASPCFRRFFCRGRLHAT